MQSFRCRWFAADIVDGRYINRTFGAPVYITAKTAELAKWCVRENIPCDVEADDGQITSVSAVAVKEDVVMRAIGAPPLPLPITAIE